MCQMLLSIYPEHVTNICRGTKRFEFRKVRCKANVTKMIIYATSPIMQVVAEAEIIDVIEDEPAIVWETTSKYAGISKKCFDNYFEGKNKAIAYQIGEVIQYSVPRDLLDYGIHNAPQSFVYINEP